MSEYFKSFRTKIESAKCVQNGQKQPISDDKVMSSKNGLRDEVLSDENVGNSPKISDRNAGIKIDGKAGWPSSENGAEKSKAKKKKMKKKKSSQPHDSTTPEDEDDLGPVFSSENRVYKESTSLDSGIESDHCRGNGNSLENDAFLSFLAHTSEDNFLEPSTRYDCPKFTLNRVDNVLAFTLHAKNVSAGSIASEVLPSINAARVKFATTPPRVQNFAFFVRLPSHSKNNNHTAMITEVTAESWDNNVVFQIDLDPRFDDELTEYMAGLDQYHLIPHPMESKLEYALSANEDDDDEGLSIEVENAAENEIKIAIKAKEPLKPQQPASVQEQESVKRRNKKQKQTNRHRAYSESCCDELKVISESECLKISSSALNGKSHDESPPSRKTRSVSESYHGPELMPIMPKYKSILKHSYDHSMSMDSSVDDLFSVSYDQPSTDHELSESCKKSVRFSDHITRQLYKSNSSILGQKKKNQRKNEAKKRAIQRKTSESDGGGDCKENQDEEDNVFSHNKGKRDSKGNLIFDLEIDDED